VSLLIAIIAIALAGVVVAVISAPLRRPPQAPAGGEPEPAPPAADRADLEAEREAKYREIRDAELDFRTGKLSQQDYSAIDGALRAEAIEILDRLEELGDEGQGA
jgi:hypothetical protein